jgi:hypothetical protein
MSTAYSTVGGLGWLLNEALASGQTFYTLLTSTPMSTNSDLAAAAAGEMSGSGYSRLPITFSSAESTLDGNVGVLSDLIQLAAVGGNIGPFTALCIVTVSAGLFGSVIAFVNYDEEQTILQGSVFSIQFPIELTTGASS